MLLPGFGAKRTVWTKHWAGGVTGKPKYYFTEIQYVGTSMTANKLAPVLAVHHPQSDARERVKSDPLSG